MLEIGHIAVLTELYEHAVEEATAKVSTRDDRWTRGVAVGSKEFVKGVAADLGARALHRKMREIGDKKFVLRDPGARYSAVSAAQIPPLTNQIA